MDHLVEVLEPGDPLVAAGDLAGAVELVGEHRVEDRVDQRRLARARHTRDGREHPEREAHVDPGEVVLARTDHGQLALGVDGTAQRRHRDGPTAGEVRAGDGLGSLEQTRIVAGVHHTSAVLASTRADVDDPVRGADRVFVVLDDDQRVAEVAQAGQRVDEAAVVPLVQTDARLVEHVEHSDEA